MADQQFKRHVAYKLRIGDLLIGKPFLNEGKLQFLELGDKKINRANLVGNIVERFDSSGDKKYVFFKLDDGSGQISLKVFGDDVDKFKEITQGKTVLVIGGLRFWNNEVYIQPEIIKEKDPKYLLVRKMESEKERNENVKPIEGNQVVALKDKILEMIKNSEEEGGIETEKIIMEIRETSPEMINKEIQKLLEEGIIFEPRPGKVRYLG